MIQNRSMMAVLDLASAAVEVPPDHLAAGLANRSSHPEASLLTIRTSEKRPENVAVRVRYMDRWFYLAANDPRSKETFILLNALFSSTAGRVPGGQPILTVPVR